MGKTNLDQFATGLVGTRSPYGACRNPFNPDYISGGSSSGSAVATALGLVSLRCDIRFKTFSVGIDIEQGSDLRDRLRKKLSGFRTHLERFAAHPGSEGVAGQQTRLWFYPDSVDLTLSPQGDLLALPGAGRAHEPKSP